jgi:hypothetical protein
MRTLVAGAPCSGKTTVSRLLRESHRRNAVDCDDILLFNSYTPLVYVRRLRQARFRIVLLDVTDEELLRRHAQRLAEEGWTNVQWFETSKATIEELRATGWIDHTISGSAPPHQIASTLLRVHSAPASPSS